MPRCDAAPPLFPSRTDGTCPVSTWSFTKGLHDIGSGCYAYLQPDGGWGLSNAGLIADGDQTLLVDTLIDLPLTAEMLAIMKDAVPAAACIGTLVNSHSHPDHTAGNSLLKGAEIITSAATEGEMRAMAQGNDPIGHIMANWQQFGEAGAYLHEIMGSKFQLGRRETVLPTRTFEDTLNLKVGDKNVTLTRIGPAHTRGDVLVHVPADRVLFTGDVLFNRVHPQLTSENLESWVKACDYILTLDVDVIVPGHGPIADKQAVRRMRDYLIYIRAEARKRFDAGLSLADAVADIALDAFDGWADEERIFMTLSNLYTEFGAPRPDMLEVMTMASRYRKAKKAKCAHCGGEH